MASPSFLPIPFATRSSSRLSEVGTPREGSPWSDGVAEEEKARLAKENTRWYQRAVDAEKEVVQLRAAMNDAV